MVIWYLNHYATPPQYGSPGRPFNLAHYFLGKGHTFINFCASFHHLRKKSAGPEDIDQVRLFSDVPYYHIKTIKYSGNGIFRIINMLGYTFEMMRLARKISTGELKKPDIIIPSCVHIFSYLAASYLKKRIGIKLIYEVRDIWPLSLIELAEVSPLNPIIIWMKRIERNAYTEADAVVSLLPNALEHMQPLGLSPERFHYIPNGINKEEWNTNSVAIPETHKKVFDWCKDKNKLIVIYTGSMGPPNALDQIFELKSFIDSREAPYHFVLIGSGSLKEKLKKAVKKEKIKFISILPRVASEIVPAILKLGDVCFIGWQKKQIYCLGISPNKLNEYFKAAKPVLHAVQAFNDPVKESGAGLSVEPYNPKQLDAALRKFFNMSEEERILVGRKGRNYLQDRLDWSTLGNKYLNLCLKLTE